ncbi:amidohydrolase [Deinococcus alpinitundrae]|uniref:amidohydrolase n=1 Tax=Deinococcus alpinitundrae TaxID=468913 RepID=UPI00137A04B0|nr:amidohydrolase [Deinococcus alpinitundrae]
MTTLPRTASGERAAALAPQLTAWRRHLHANPELGFHEVETSAYIAAELGKLAHLEISRPSETSVLAVLKGQKPGQTVLLRADIDALPITEENSFEFVSKNAGVMHACGHDGHTAILLGVARLLSEAPEEVSGEIRMIFQHAEEIGPGGAEELVRDTPLMDGVDVVTGLHLSSQLPTGVVAVKPGAFMAAPDMFEITIRGRGGHAAHPEEAVDPIAVGAQVVTNLQHVVSRGVSALDNLVVSVTYFQAGTTHNVIPDRAELMGTVRSFDPELRQRAPKLIERVLKGVTEAHGATYTLKYEMGYRPVINTDWVADKLMAIAQAEVGDQAQLAKPSMGGEDFSAYLTRAPGAYFNVGSGNALLESDYPHHHPRFTLDEESLVTGVRMLHAAALSLGQG